MCDVKKLSLVSLLIVSLLPVPASAEYTNKTNFWNWLAGAGGIVQDIAGAVSPSACPDSPDGKHHATSAQSNAVAGRYFCICRYCGSNFVAYSTGGDGDSKDYVASQWTQGGAFGSSSGGSRGDLVGTTSDSYDDYVASCPFSSYSSDGSFLWQSTFADLTIPSSIDDLLTIKAVNGETIDWSLVTWKYKLVNPYTFSFEWNFLGDGNSPWTHTTYCSQMQLKVPYRANYKCLTSPCLSARNGYYLSSSASSPYVSKTDTSYPAGSAFYRDKGGLVKLFDSSCFVYKKSQYYRGLFYTPLYQVTLLENDPFASSSASGSGDYGLNTRPGAVVGGFGDENGNAFSNSSSGADGAVQSDENFYIVDEETNTFYNPVTNTTSVIQTWNYDYSDRSYNVTTTTGDTVTVTYGDENITIHEGDTVYNVYYLSADSSGSSGSDVTVPDVPVEHKHSYVGTVTSEPSCILSGVKTFVCSDCNDSYTQSMPPVGHSWVIKNQVLTSYDENGELVQQGYTVYKCSVCGEEYKDVEGTGPPAGGGGDEDSGGGLLEGVLNTVGSVFGGIASLLSSAIEAIASIGELLASFISVLSGCFGSFTDFLSAVFPFLPEEFFVILNLGILLMVAAGVLRRFLG